MDESALGGAPAPGSGTLRRMLQAVSRIFNPLYLTPPAMLAICLRVAPDFASGLLWFLIYIFFSTVIPLADLGWRRSTGRISDWHISRREERPVPLLFGLAYALLGTLAMLLLQAPRELAACMVTGLATGAAALAITLGWKISLHTMGNSLLATLLLLVFRTGWAHPLPWSLAGLVALTGISRVYLRQHTAIQVAAGALTGVATGTAVFAAFGLL